MISWDGKVLHTYPLSCQARRIDTGIALRPQEIVPQAHREAPAFAPCGLPVGAYFSSRSLESTSEGGCKNLFSIK